MKVHKIIVLWSSKLGVVTSSPRHILLEILIYSFGEIRDILTVKIDYLELVEGYTERRGFTATTTKKSQGDGSRRNRA